MGCQRPINSVHASEAGIGAKTVKMLGRGTPAPLEGEPSSAAFMFRDVGGLPLIPGSGIARLRAVTWT